MLRHASGLLVLLLACDASDPAPPASSSAPPAASTAAAPITTATTSTAATSATASTSAAARTDACDPDARRSAEEHFCIKLPKGWKPQEYNGDDAKGWAEEALYDRDEDTIAITWQELGKAPHLSAMRGCSDASVLRDEAKSPSATEKLMGSGDLPGGGFWFDKDVGAGKRRICSAIQTKTHMVSCSYLVPAAKADIALETCKSLRSID